MEINDFKLDSVKILDKAVHVEYHTSTDSAKRTYDKPVKERSPHPHFRNSLKVFVHYYEKTFGFSEGDFNVEIKGVTINSKDQIQLTGMIDAVNGSMCSLNTTFIPFDCDEPDFDGKDIMMNLENVRVEAFQYMIEGKAAQTEMDFSEDNVLKK